jgi:ribosomal RNA-processing protein 9
MKPRYRKSIPNSKKKKSHSHDDFFQSAAKKRRKSALDETIESDDSDEDALKGGYSENGEIEETADEKRVRVATEHLERIRALAKKIEQEEEQDGEGEDEREGKMDSLVAEILQKDQLEESGRVRRFFAKR